MERIELSCHTTLSRMDGLISPRKLVNHAWENGCHAVAITDFNSVQAFPEAARAVESLKRRCKRENIQFNFKVLYGLETKLEDGSLVHLIAQNRAGLGSLYRLVEAAYQNNSLSKNQIVQHRDGILVGSPGEGGELYRALLSNTDAEKLTNIVGFYDYLEVLPPECCRLLSAQERFPQNVVFEMEDLVHKIVLLGAQFHKQVAAIGNMRFFCPEDMNAYRVLKTEKDVLPLYLRSAENMLDAFSFLGEALAKEVVIEVPNRLSGLCEEIEILSDKPLYPIVPNAFESINVLCQERLQILYGNHAPRAVKERLEQELSFLQNSEVSCSIFLIVRHLALGLQKRRIRFSFRGCAAASYVAYLLDITDIDPLKLRIPCETLFGYDGVREPNIDINIQSGHFEDAREILAEIFSSDALLQAGNTQYVNEQIAPSICRDYIAKYGKLLTDVQFAEIAESMRPVKRSFHIRNDHFIIAPDVKAVKELVPVCKLSDHNFLLSDYHCYENNLFKLDILANTPLDLLHRLEDLTGVSAASLDPAKTVPLLLQDSINIPEFDTPKMRKIWELADPQTLDDLIKLDALSHSIGGWEDNAELLLREGIASVGEIIGSRDDIFSRLLDAGFNRKFSFQVMESVRKGKGLKKDWGQTLLDAGIPSWYVDSCNKIAYLFPKAHCACYTIVAIKVAWFKSHSPEAYAQAYAELYGGEEDM